MTDCFDHNEKKGSGSFSPYYFPEIPAAGINRIKINAGKKKRVTNCLGTFECMDLHKAGASDKETMDKTVSRQAYRKGFDKGKEAALKQQQLKAESAIKGLHQAADALEHLKEKKRVEAEIETVRLSMVVAKKIIEMEIKSNPEVICNTVINAMHQVRDVKGVVIRVNPGDLETITAFKGELAAAFKTDDDVMIEADTSIKRGGCIIDTAFGDIDASIDNQLSVMESALKAHLPVEKSKG